MRWVLAVLVLALAGALVVATGGDDGDDDEEREVVSSVTTLEVAVDEPLVSGRPVTWQVTVVVEGEALPVTFPSGQSADVRLLDGSREVYRWSAALSFTQAIREVTLQPGRTTFTLDEPELDVPPGEYDLVAELAARPAPAPARRQVTVEPG
jgi:hypothetical protein